MAEALALMQADENRVRPYIFGVWAPATGAVIGFLTVCFVKYGTKRPWYSGIQKHIITAGAFAYGFSVADRCREQYLAERDATYRHYVELHPEDFIAEARKKYGQILEPWTPIR